MGSKRLSDALATLAGGLQTIAQGRFRTEERENAMAFEREMQDSRQQFSQRLQELQMQHSTQMQERGFEQQEQILDKQQDFSREQFQSEQAAIAARHAQSMAAEWARIKQAGANQAMAMSERADAKEERQLQRQLGVYELQVNTAKSQLSSVMDAMNKELGELSKNQMLMLDKTGKMSAAQKAIEARYAPMLKEAKDEMQNGISRYSSAVGVKADFSDVQTGGDGATSGMRDKVTAAADAAMAQIGNGPMPPEQNLIAGFMKGGLSRTEALAAARTVRSRQTGK